MGQILTISLREITRLRSRFSGGASPLAVVILLLVVGASAYAMRGVSVLGSGLYRVGVYGDVPAIQDSRFAVKKVEPAQAQALLERGEIDVFINGKQVTARQDDKSRYALASLRHTLEKLELERVGNAYPADTAFPLHVGINYLDITPQQVAAQPAPGQAPQAPPQEEIVIPSLTPPPAPFTQVILALIYILPVTFISIFFTSSFMDEKTNRRLIVLLSTPVTPFQIIVGKMLPYAIFALLATALIAILTNGNVLMALAIFLPAILFIFAIYLMVPMFYRTFKDITFISMLVTTLTTAYLVFPAMFTGISDMSYMSPLTLAIKMYRDEAIGWREYLFPSLPMVAIFGLAMYASTRMLNEEFLMGYRPITRKMADGVYLMLDRTRPYLSVALFSLLFIPVVYIMQLVILAIATNLPVGVMLGVTLVAAVLIEEIVKSISIVVLIEHGIVRSVKSLILLALLSALGFLVGEKLLLFFSVSMVSEMRMSDMVFSAGGLLLVPLAAHFVFTLIVSFLKYKFKMRYAYVLIISAILHSFYNWFLLGGLR
jgi:ABC-type Na+ efflux pump permease subunit